MVDGKKDFPQAPVKSSRHGHQARQRSDDLGAFASE